MNTLFHVFLILSSMLIMLFSGALLK